MAWSSTPSTRQAGVTSHRWRGGLHAVARARSDDSGTGGSESFPRDAGIMAESTKEATDEGAKVTTVAEGADATAAPPAEDKKSMLMALGIPEEVADAAIASDGDGFRDGASRVSMFYSLKVNDDAKPEWKDHYLAYTKGAKASKGHVNVSHSYNEETKEVICIVRAQRLRRARRWRALQ